MRPVGNTKARAITEAKALLQCVGYNGFSFQHIADAIGIKKPSLYEHFKSKEDLGKSLIEDYKRSFVEWTETVSVFEPDAQIGALFELFFKFAGDSKKLCPLSAMIGDLNSLPKRMKNALEGLYETRRLWIKEVIKRGQGQKIFRKDKSAEELANLILAMGLGAQLTARVSGRPDLVRELKTRALEVLGPSEE